ncbi:MAG: hypothetical protein R3B48_14510 [Kofleriaceae bacterium]
MTALSTFRIACLAAAFSACTVGEVGLPDGGGGGGGGGQSFTAMIAPLVTSCTGCHGSGGSPPTLTSFSALQDKYKMKPGNTNIFVTKGDHQSIVYLTADQTAIVAAWIDGLP